MIEFSRREQSSGESREGIARGAAEVSQLAAGNAPDRLNPSQLIEVVIHHHSLLILYVDASFSYWFMLTFYLDKGQRVFGAWDSGSDFMKLWGEKQVESLILKNFTSGLLICINT